MRSRWAHLYSSWFIALVRNCRILSVQYRGEDVCPRGDSAQDVAGKERHEDNEPLDIPILTCRCCSARFSSVKQQRSHFSSDWHRFNLKLRLVGGQPVSEKHVIQLLRSGPLSDHDDDPEDYWRAREQEWQKLGDLSLYDRHQGIQELSTQEKDQQEFEQIGVQDIPKSSQQHSLLDEDSRVLIYRQPSQPPLPTQRQKEEHLGSQYQHMVELTLSIEDGRVCRLGIWKCVMKPQMPDADLINWNDSLQELCENTRWAVLMCSGGDFAGGIFEGDRCIEHKTFHRYTIRRKQGKLQSTRDASGSAPHSAGATIRRHSQQRFAEEVHELLLRWGSLLTSCSRVFIASALPTRLLLHQHDSPLPRNHSSIRIIPVRTGRPSLAEVTRLHQCMSRVELIPEEETTLSPSDQPEDSSEPCSCSNSPCPTSYVPDVPDAFCAADGVGVGEQSSHEHSVFQLSWDGDILNNELLEGIPEQKDDSELLERVLHVASPLKEPEQQRIIEECNKPDTEIVASEPPLSSRSVSCDCSVSGSAISQVGVENSEETNVPENTETLRKALITGSIEAAVRSAQEYFLRNENSLSNLKRSEPKLSTSLLCAAASNIGSEEDSIHLVACLVDNFDLPLDSLDKSSSSSPLHVASSAGRPNLVRYLLERGASPSYKFDGRNPYQIALDRSTRDAFRLFASDNPSLYDWSRLGIQPQTLEQQEAQRSQRAAYRRKKRNSKSKQRAVSSEEVQTIHEPDYVCTMCSEPKNGVPFERIGLVFCSVSCALEHMKQFGEYLSCETDI